MLGLAITPAAYRTLAGADFVTPIRPANLVIPAFASNVQVTEIMQAYLEALKEYNKYLDMVKAFKNQLLAAFDNDYFLAVYNQATSHEGTTVLALLQHLYENCGQLDSTQLPANIDEIQGDYNPTTPTKIYIALI
eukprot:2747409-Ditylum_brightwellii.AAC.1